MQKKYKRVKNTKKIQKKYKKNTKKIHKKYASHRQTQSQHHLDCPKNALYTGRPRDPNAKVRKPIDCGSSSSARSRGLAPTTWTSTSNALAVIVGRQAKVDEDDDDDRENDDEDDDDDDDDDGAAAGDV
jgi:hypothetical protein